MGSVTLTKSVRQVTGAWIDDRVDWLTREADWMFGGISDAVSYSLISIEDVLKWVPWPAIIVGLALISYAVGRWLLMAFTTGAMLYFGFMGLWKTPSIQSLSWSLPSSYPWQLDCQLG